jgi:hypothetical protein
MGLFKKAPEPEPEPTGECDCGAYAVRCVCNMPPRTEKK